VLFELTIEEVGFNSDLTYLIMSCPYFWIPLFGNGNDFRGSLVKKKGVKKGYLMSLS
jgi:hypothetical protein